VRGRAAEGGRGSLTSRLESELAHLIVLVDNPAAILRSFLVANFLFAGPGFGLLADNLDEISHRNIEIDEMKPPVRLDSICRAEITDDVVRPRIRWIAMDCDLQIRGVLIRFALCRQQSGDAHPGRIDCAFRHNPGFWWTCAYN